MSDELLEAIQTRNVDRVATLLAAGADPNEPGKSRYGLGGNLTPLHAAVCELKAFGEKKPAGPIELLILVLRHGARANGWDMSKEGLPLLHAVEMNHIEAVRLLLAHGAEPNVRNDDGDSPLCICLQKGYLEMARLLLICGANKAINEANSGGLDMTILGRAVFWLNVEMVRLLLTHGADPNVLDNDRYTAFDHLRLMDPPNDPVSQSRLHEIRSLLGEPKANV